MDWILKSLINDSFKVDVRGLEKLEFNEPTILMANHTSLLDAVILAANLPKEVYFVVNSDVAENPKYKHIIKMRNHIRVDFKSPYSLRTMLRVIKEGKPLLIFPEGRITTTGGLMKIYNGISYLAMRSNAKVYPIILDGLEYSKMSYLDGKTKRIMFPKVTVTVGDSFYLEKEEGKLVKELKKKSSSKILEVLRTEKCNSNLLRRDKINLFNELLNAVEIYGEDYKIVEDHNEANTYGEFLLKVYVMSEKIKSLSNGEERISTFLPTSIGHAIVVFSMFKEGITPVILNFSLGLKELTAAIETANIKTIVTSREFLVKGNFIKVIDDLVNYTNVRVIYAEDVKENISLKDKLMGMFNYEMGVKSKYSNGEIILFTSGSESTPKGVILTHRNIFSNIIQARCVIDFTSQDKLFNALPMFHSFGMTAGTLLPILSGVSVYLHPSPLHKAIPELSYLSNATIIFGTSTFLSMYGRNAESYDFYSMRYVVAGGEKLKDEVRELWLDKFGIRIIEGYGVTEASPILSLNTPLTFKKGTVGKFLPLVEYKIEKVDGVDTGGNLFVKGPNIMKGYLIHNKGFIPAEEWYDTGDVVDIDEDGFITIKARIKRFAKIGGEMISLNLVEQICEECFGVDQFASVNIPDLRKGEKIILFTTFKDVDKVKLQEYLRINQYSNLIMPAEIKIIEKFPTLGSGKINYKELKDLI